jgi:hypothetical protein
MAAAFLGEVTKSRGEVDARSIVVYLDEWLASDEEAAERARLEFADAIVLKAAVSPSMIVQIDMIARKALRTWDGVRARQDTIVLRFLHIIMVSKPCADTVISRMREFAERRPPPCAHVHKHRELREDRVRGGHQRHRRPLTQH